MKYTHTYLFSCLAHYFFSSRWSNKLWLLLFLDTCWLDLGQWETLELTKMKGGWGQNCIPLVPFCQMGKVGYILPNITVAGSTTTTLLRYWQPSSLWVETFPVVLVFHSNYLLILYPWLTSFNPAYTFVNKPFIKVPLIIPSECVISFLFDSICVLLYVNTRNISQIPRATSDLYLLVLIHSTLHCVLSPVHIHEKLSIVLWWGLCFMSLCFEYVSFYLFFSFLCIAFSDTLGQNLWLSELLGHKIFM